LAQSRAKQTEEAMNMNVQDPELRLAFARQNLCCAIDAVLAEHASQKKRRRKKRAVRAKKKK